MTEHLTEPEIELYRRREGEAEGQGAARHLAVCEHCMRRVYNTDHSALAVKALTEAFLPSVNEEPFHLSSAELAEYVSGRADKADRIICESHIDICEQCNQELRLLSAAQTPTTPAGMAWLRPWWTSMPLRVTATIALIGLLAFGVLLIRRRSSAPTTPLAGNGKPQTPGVSVPGNPPRDGLTGDKVPSPPASSQQFVVVRLNDNGREIGLDQQGKLSGLEAFDESTRRIVKNGLAGDPLAKPGVLEELSSPRLELLGDQSGENTFQIVSPLGRIITEARPTLKWKQLIGATSYVASVFDSKFNLVVKSAPLSQPTWTVSAPLQRGENYSWQVTAVKGAKEIVAPVAPAPRAQFRILEADKLSALQNLKRQRPTSHLALGLTYARFGLIKEAEGEFQQLLKENPDSAIAKRLLRTVQTWR